MYWMANMIEVTRDQLIPIRDVPRLLPPRSSGRPVHISAVYRWVQRGVRGVRLETIQVGGTRYTSVEALQRFADHLGRSKEQTPQQLTTPRQRQKQIARAAEEVARILGTGKKRG